MPYTQLVVVPALDLTPEELDIGDRLEFLTKTNTRDAKIQAWAAAIEASAASLNALGAELEAAQLSDATELAQKLDLAGGTMSGNLNIVFASGDPTLILNGTDANSRSRIYFRTSGILVNDFVSAPEWFQIRHTHSAGGSNSSITLYDDYAYCSVPLRSAEPVGNTDLTTKNYVDDTAAEKLDLAGGIIDGNLRIQPGADLARLFLHSPGGAQALLYFYTDTDTQTAIISGSPDSLVLTHKTSVPGIATTIQMFDDYSYANKEFRVPPIYNPATASDNAATPKGYVDTYFASLDYVNTTLAPLIGARFVSTLVIEKDDAAAFLVIDAGVGAPAINLKRGGVTALHIDANASSSIIQHTRDDGGYNLLSFWDAYAEFTHPVVSPTTTDGSTANTLTTKNYVDAKHALQLLKSGDVMTGDLSVTKNSPAINLDASGTTIASVGFKRSGTATANLSCYTDRLEMVRDTNAIRLYDGYTYSTQPVRGIATVPSDPSSTLTTKGYVDDILEALVVAGGGATIDTIPGLRAELDALVQSVADNAQAIIDLPTSQTTGITVDAG